MNPSVGRSVDGVVHDALIFPDGIASVSPWLQLIELFNYFQAQLVAFQTQLCPTGFSTVLASSSFMALPGSYPAVEPRAVAIF
jgi:hypothetical protein